MNTIMETEDRNKNFNTPEGYFNTLADDICTNIFIYDFKAKNLETGFIVPNNYFESLEIKLNALSITAITQVSHIKRNVFKLNIIKYAVAACVLLICGFAIFINLSENKLQYQLANIPNEDIEIYLQNNTSSTDLPLIIENISEIKVVVDKNISIKELNEYLNETI